jgi:2-iminobutanoate/2-iminopropanoate deaminase
MTKQIIGGQSAQGLPFSKAVRAGDFVYVSGQVAMDSAGVLVRGGIEAETRQVFANLEAVLQEAGCELSDVIKVNVWLDDPRDFGLFNTTYAEIFTNDAPARSTVRSEMMIDVKIEADCIAYRPL